MSPLLFILVVDVLAKIIGKGTELGFIQRVRDFPIAYGIGCLQYAYDTLLVVPADHRSILNLKVFMHGFQLLSGLQINLAKSGLYRLGNSSDHQIAMATSIFQCDERRNPLMYLGIPLRHKSPTHDDWMPLIGRIDKRLGGWKGNCLSGGGRLVLVTRFLTSMPLHFISFFTMYMWVMEDR